MVWGAAIAAGASLAGGAMGMASNSATNAANKEIMEMQLAFQREMAQNGIRWKVADANAAGIHPVYALGAPPFNPSPVAIGQQSDNSMGNAIADAGQHIGRAIDATRSREEKVDAYQQQSAELTLQGMKLDNEFKAAQIGAMLKSTIGPPWPDPYSGHNPAFVDSGPPSNSDSKNSTAYRPFGLTGTGANAAGLVKPVPHAPVNRNPDRPSMEPGDIVDTGWARTPTGWTPVPSKDVKERIEDNLISETLWEMRNRIPPSFFGEFNPPFPAPPGQQWIWSTARQEYQLVEAGSRRRDGFFWPWERR